MPTLMEPATRLEPLKTLHETRANDQYIEALVFEIPAKLASRAVSIVKPVIQDANPKQPHLHHLRKLIHLPHLPKDLLKRRLVVTRPGQPSVFLIQVAGQELAAAMLDALKDRMDEDASLALYDHLPRCFPIPVPLYAPLDDQQAKLWSERYWPTIYNPASQVLQDAPPLHQLRKVMAEQDSDFTDRCIDLALRAASETRAAGYGCDVGAVVADPVTKQVIALAGDARWLGEETHEATNGRPEYHALMRAISMVANKELRRRLAAGRHAKFADTCMEGPSGQPVNDLEAHFMQATDEDDLHQSIDALTLSDLPRRQVGVRPEGYLCSGLDLYLTHEPCVCCAMAMVHSRFRTCTFVDRMPKTGALCAKIHKTSLGYGLFWRRELNWRVMTFHYKGNCVDGRPAVSTAVFQA